MIIQDDRKTYDDRKQPDVWPIVSDREIARLIREEKLREAEAARRATR